MSRLIQVIQKTKRIFSSNKINSYIRNGRIPWTEGYSEYKIKVITNLINSPEDLSAFTKKLLPKNFGISIDERIVEYPWMFSKLSKANGLILDAGSALNFKHIIEHPVFHNKELTIYTLMPEGECFFRNKINYVFGDLRNMFFRNVTFDEIVSISTIEHIGMDNSIYGDIKKDVVENKSYEYLRAILEMIRILKPQGKLLLTFPFGQYEHHGFFQQFDDEMLQKLIELFVGIGSVSVDYFKYESNGWRFAERDELKDVKSYNPHTGIGKGTDGAAHCRSIACIEFIKNN